MMYKIQTFFFLNLFIYAKCTIFEDTEMLSDSCNVIRLEQLFLKLNISNDKYSQFRRNGRKRDFNFECL